MNRLNPLALGISAAITFAILYVACALTFALAPDAALEFFNAWVHGIDLPVLKPAAGKALTLGVFLYGLVGIAVTSFVAGFLLAFFYNLLSRG